jgi:hypothetical protein
MNWVLGHAASVAPPLQDPESVYFRRIERQKQGADLLLLGKKRMSTPHFFQLEQLDMLNSLIYHNNICCHKDNTLPCVALRRAVAL